MSRARSKAWARATITGVVRVDALAFTCNTTSSTPVPVAETAVIDDVRGLARGRATTSSTSRLTSNTTRTICRKAHRTSVSVIVPVTPGLATEAAVGAIAATCRSPKLGSHGEKGSLRRHSASASGAIGGTRLGERYGHSSVRKDKKHKQLTFVIVCRFMYLNGNQLGRKCGG